MEAKPVKPAPRPAPRAAKAPRPAAAPAAPAPAPGGISPLLPEWVQRVHRHRGVLVPIGSILLLGVLLVPLPPMAMDVLIALNISLGLVILLTTIYMEHPLDFSVFPSLLLATTLFRLVLNIASTRLILTADAANPQEAAASAGHVIMAFGEFVAGNSLFVGIVVFLILVIVQFVVITKGATRISEVAARFTLDAMPGKQMAIDADLAAGIIDESEARRRRERVAQEADFFGAMDGASKFVRGDAIAGIIITAVNVLGGFAVGMIQRGWPAGEVAEVYTKLTIGDGLTAQIPSFVIALASALIVTRSGSKQGLGEELTGQLISQPKGLYITSGFLVLLSLTPLPSLPLLASAAVLGAIAYFMGRNTRAVAAEESSKAQAAAAAPDPPAVDQLLKVDTMELEVGYALVALVDTARGGDLMERIAAVRRQLAAEIGLVMPPVRIRDNMQLGPTDYRIKIRGNVVAEGQTRPDRLLAIDPGLGAGSLPGEKTREPVFGLDAWWIDPALQSRAETMNFSVYEPSRVVATHVTETVRRFADELLTRDEVNNLVEGLKQRAPKLVEEVIPAVLKPAELQKILQNLLRERVSIRDLESILETLSEWAPKTKDTEVLTEYARNGLRRAICTQYAQPTEAGRLKIVCVTLDPTMEDLISSYVERGPAGTSINIPARTAAKVAQQITGALQRVVSNGYPPVVIASPTVRGIVRQIVEPYLANITVLGYNEIVPTIEVESMALVMPPPEQAVPAREAVPA
ncbi:MAG: flagellar biosynthesis protein FlhA [Phycisphaerales bacterium]|nr:flagellar biosynthesis protein FlhA [Phycisphaerales bacterium]